MQLVERPRNDVHVNIVFIMRHSGATLQQIAERLDKTKERVRQILIENYGSTGHGLISTEKLRKQLGLSRARVMELYNNDVITPKKEWITNGTHYLLWSPGMAKKASIYLNTGVLCKVCNRPVPRNRRNFCSTECYLENHRYKNKNDEDKKRHLENVRRYRKKKKLMKPSLVVK
jgi:hypothetical protein